PLANDTTETDVGRGRIDRLRVARGRAIPAAVVRRAEMRTALQNLARNPDVRLAGVVARGFRPAARVLRNAARLRRVGFVPGRIPIRGPFPHVADHIVEAVAVRRKGGDRRRALEPVEREVLVREIALPGVRHLPAAWGESVAPGE